MQRCNCQSMWYTWAVIPSDTSYSDIRSYFTRTKQPGMGRKRINTRGMSTLPQRKIQLPLRPRKLLIANVTRLQPFIVGGDSFPEHVEALISYNLCNNGYQQDCIYIEQGHLITRTSFMTHSMAIDPQHTIVVSWTPIPLCILQAASQPWCPVQLPSSTS